MQFRIHESQLYQTFFLIIAWYFFCKNWISILSSFQEFLIWGIPHFGNSWNEGSLILGILDLRDPLFQEFWARWLRGKYETNSYFGGFTQFFVPFFASRQSLCTWHRYFEKKSVRACFFWLQGALIQKSATPQGSPPPTQQIKFQMQISWVGRSTMDKCDLSHLS